MCKQGVCRREKVCVTYLGYCTFGPFLGWGNTILYTHGEDGWINLEMVNISYIVYATSLYSINVI